METKNYRENDEIEIDLIELAKMFLQRWWLIVICTVLGGAIALFGTLAFVAPLYQTEIMLYPELFTVVR